MKLLTPSPYWEYPVVHLVYFVMYLAALASFEFLTRAFIDYHRRSGNGTAEDGSVSLPEWAWVDARLKEESSRMIYLAGPA